MNHPDAGAVATWCTSNCAALALLQFSRKPTAQARVARTGILELGITNKVTAP